MIGCREVQADNLTRLDNCLIYSLSANSNCKVKDLIRLLFKTTNSAKLHACVTPAVCMSQIMHATDLNVCWVSTKSVHYEVSQANPGFEEAPQFSAIDADMDFRQSG